MEGVDEHPAGVRWSCELLDLPCDVLDDVFLSLKGPLTDELFFD